MIRLRHFLRRKPTKMEILDKLKFQLKVMMIKHKIWANVQESIPFFTHEEEKFLENWWDENLIYWDIMELVDEITCGDYNHPLHINTQHELEGAGFVLMG
jgi:hypothetical protein